MPAPKAGQSGSSQSAVITLAALFLIAAILAVVFYIKGEGYSSQAQTAATQIKSAKSNENAMQKSFDEMTRMALGQIPADSAADAKLKAVKDKFQELLADLSTKVDTFKGASADTEGMLSVVERMKDVTIAAKAAEATSQQRVAELGAENETLRKTTLEKEEQYAQLIQKFAADANNTQKNFGSLQGQMDQNAKDQAAMIEQKLATSEDTGKNLQTELKNTKTQLDVAKEKLVIAQSQLSKIVPPQDPNVAAFKADGQIISIDNKAGLVYINLGLVDKVYRGLTFSVYDKGLPIPRDGEGKAEIEILEPRERMSIARIAVLKPKKTVMVDDTIANLVWDSQRSRVFVVAGDFDFDKNGIPDADGARKVEALITKWGGTVAGNITPSTDFVVLGSEPKAPVKPSGEEIQVDPAAMKKYDAAVAAQQAYRGIVAQATAFSLPILNLERFLYMTGYEAMSPKGSVILKQ
jgi:hypothetical protein